MSHFYINIFKTMVQIKNQRFVLSIMHIEKALLSNNDNNALKRNDSLPMGFSFFCCWKQIDSSLWVKKPISVDKTCLFDSKPDCKWL